MSDCSYNCNDGWLPPTLHKDRAGFVVRWTSNPCPRCNFRSPAYRRADIPPTQAQIMADPRVKALVGAVSMVFLHGSVHRDCADREFQLPLWVSDELRAALAQIKEPKP